MTEPVAESDRSWAASPCSTCQTSPCCTRLPVYRFHIESRRDVERARTLLADRRIELGLYDTGWWMAYYLAPCRFLNPLDSKCLVHGSPRQPQICRDYSPVRCWYKRVFAPSSPDAAAGREVDGSASGRPVTPASSTPIDFIRFDSRRFSELEGMIAFDEADELAVVPPWEELHARMSALPLTETTAAGHPIEQVAPAENSGLAFPIRTPRSKRDLDLVRFRLGFHGVRIGVNGEEWSILIGSSPKTARYLVISYEQIEALIAAFTFDEQGRIQRAPHLTAALQVASALQPTETQHLSVATQPTAILPSGDALPANPFGSAMPPADS